MATKPNSGNSKYDAINGFSDTNPNIRPASSFVTDGWITGDKPPASTFNFFFDYLFRWSKYLIDWTDELAVTNTKRIVTKLGHGFSNDFVYCNTSGVWNKADASDVNKSATHFAVRIDDDNFYALTSGEVDMSGILDEAGSSLDDGTYYYLSDSAPGKTTKTKPSTNVLQTVFKTNDTKLTLLLDTPINLLINKSYYPIGAIFDWGLTTPPIGAALLNGQTVLVADYPDFETKVASDGLIDAYNQSTGKPYKYNNSSNTGIILPDLRGRVTIGAGTGAGLTVRTIGESGGYETHTLTVDEMPSHTHDLKYSTAGSGTGGYIDSDSATTNFNLTTTTESTGGDQAHNNMQPYFVLNKAIQLKEIF